MPNARSRNLSLARLLQLDFKNVFVQWGELLQMLKVPVLGQWSAELWFAELCMRDGV